MSNFDDLDNFFLEGDLDNDPFAPSKDSNKRKSPGDVNVDDEVSVAKKARVPRIKLDGERYALNNSTAYTHLLPPADILPDSFHKKAYRRSAKEQET